MGATLLPIFREILFSVLLSYAGKVAHLCLLYILKKLLQGLHWVSINTPYKGDDELVALLEKALDLQEAEPIPDTTLPDKP